MHPIACKISRNLILERLKLQNVTTYIYTQIARDLYLECSRVTECSRTVVHDCGVQNSLRYMQLRVHITNILLNQN